MKVQEALKAALAAIDLYDYTGTQAESELYDKAESLCKSALSDMEKREPVGWQFYQDGKWHNGMDTNNHKQNTIDAGIPIRELYTSSISKEWVGLSDQQIQNLIINSDNYNKFQFIKSVEHTVKQLNAPEKG